MKRNIRAGVPSYTYRQTNKEEKLIYRRLAIIGGLTVVLLLIIWFWGLTFVRVIGWLGTRNSSSQSTSTEYEIPLQQPTLSDLPEFTNQDKITVSGLTSADASVSLTVNGAAGGKTVADSTGSFTFVNVSLKVGTNLIKVTASDNNGKSLDTSTIVTLDKQPPDLQISQPTDGQSFPNSTQQVTIKGTTESTATVFVNSIQAMIDQNGGFSYNLSVSPGENKIEIKSTDQAGNSNIINLTVTVAQ